MPRRAAAPKTSKRDRSDSASLTPPPPDAALMAIAAAEADVTSPAKGSKGKVKAPAKGKGKGAIANGVVEPVSKKPRTSKVKAEADADGDEEKPKKKVKKADQWPPADLDPSLHPARHGYPPYQAGTATSGANGGIAPPGSFEGKPLFLGAHTSIGGGPATALLRAGMAGANGLAMFVKSQRQWKSNPYEPVAVERFRELMKPREEGGLGYPAETILVHGSYLINLGNPDPAKWNTSYQCFKDDIERCHQLGIRMYNWHPGSTVGACTKEESLANIARGINKVHNEVPEVITVIENMANAKSNLVGTAFSELGTIIAQVKDKNRVRICLDTCHMFAAGYDIRTPETYAATMKKFDEEVGNGYLAGIHLNDSKTELGSCKDLHENIGLGHIGLSAFRSIMRDPLMAGIPLVLETPQANNPLEVGEFSLWRLEIQMLYEIQKIEDDEWETKKVEIEQRWRAERDKLNPPKPAKEKKVKATNGAQAKGKPKGKKGKKDEDSDEACESHTESD